MRVPLFSSWPSYLGGFVQSEGEYIGGLLDSHPTVNKKESVLPVSDRQEIVAQRAALIRSFGMIAF